MADWFKNKSFVFNIQGGSIREYYRLGNVRSNSSTSEERNICIHKEDNYLHIQERYQLWIKIWVERWEYLNLFLCETLSSNPPSKNWNSLPFLTHFLIYVSPLLPFLHCWIPFLNSSRKKIFSSCFSKRSYGMVSSCYLYNKFYCKLKIKYDINFDHSILYIRHS